MYATHSRNTHHAEEILAYMAGYILEVLINCGGEVLQKLIKHNRKIKSVMRNAMRRYINSCIKRIYDDTGKKKSMLVYYGMCEKGVHLMNYRKDKKKCKR